jgi:hypothetical protein
MSFGPSAKTPPRHLGPAPRRGWAADAAAEPQIRVEPRRTSTGDDMSPPASPITGGWFRSRLSGDGSPPRTPETRPESPFSLGGLAARAGDALRADNEALFRQGLFNAVGNAILLLLVGLLYAVSSLLSQYRAPILWAVLVSLALRDVKVALVRFWTDQLTRHTLAGVALAPARAAVQAARRARAFAAETVAAVFAERSATNRERPPRFSSNGGKSVSSVRPEEPSHGRSRRRYMNASATRGDRLSADGLRGQSPIAPETRFDASTFHFRWLFFLGCATETYALAARDWDLTRSVIALGAVLCAAAFATTGVVVAADFYLFKRAGAFGSPFVFGPNLVAEENRRGEGDAAAARRGADADDAGAFGGGPATDAATDGRTETETNEPKTIFSRAVRLYLRLDLAIRRVVLANLHALVATGLIVGGIALAFAVAAFFTVNVARESAEAVAAAREAVLEGSRAGGAGLGGLTRQIRDAQGVAEGRWQKEWSSAVETHWPRVLRFARAKAEEAFPEANATEVWEAMQHLYFSAQEAATGSRGGGSGDRDMSRSGGNVVRNVSTTAVLRAGKMLGAGDVAGAVAAAREIAAAVASDASARSPLRALLRVWSIVAEALKTRASVIFAGSTKGVGALVSLASSLFASAFGVAGATASFFLEVRGFLHRAVPRVGERGGPRNAFSGAHPSERPREGSRGAFSDRVRARRVRVLPEARAVPRRVHLGHLPRVRRALRVHQHARVGRDGDSAPARVLERESARGVRAGGERLCGEGRRARRRALGHARVRGHRHLPDGD